MKKLNDIKFFISKKPGKEGHKVAQVRIKGADHIILVPDQFQNKIKLGLSYDLKCEPLSQGKGFTVVKFRPHIIDVKLILSSDLRALTVTTDGKEVPQLSYHLGRNNTTPYEFYSENKYEFTRKVVSNNSIYFTDWARKLQDISLKWDMEWPNATDGFQVHVVTSNIGDTLYENDVHNFEDEEILFDKPIR